MNPIFSLIAENTALISFLTLLVAIVVPLLAWATGRFGSVSIREKLEDRDSWDALAKKYSGSTSDAYFDALDKVLEVAAGIYGKRAVSFEAFDRCLLFACVYPAIGLLFGWVIFDTGQFGGIDVMPAGKDIFTRTWQTLLVVSLAAIAGGSLYFSDRLSQAASAWILQNMAAQNAFATFLRPKIATLTDYAIFFGSCFMVGIATAFSSIYVFEPTGDSGVAAGAATFTIAVAAIFFGGIFVAGASTLVLVLTWIEVAGPTFAATMFLFLAVLPWLNALADMISLWATRSFLGHVAKTRPGLGRILILLWLDLCVATLCLFGLLWSFTLVLDFWTWIRPGTISFDWRVYRDAVFEDATLGAPLYLMIATTLLPTAVHLVAGIAALITYKSRLTARVGRRISEMLGDSSGPIFSKEELDQRIGELRTAWFLGLFCATILTILIGIVAWAIGFQIWSWIA